MAFVFDMSTGGFKDDATGQLGHYDAMTNSIVADAPAPLAIPVDTPTFNYMDQTVPKYDFSAMSDPAVQAALALITPSTQPVKYTPELINQFQPNSVETLLAQSKTNVLGDYSNSVKNKDGSLASIFAYDTFGGGQPNWYYKDADGQLMKGYNTYVAANGEPNQYGENHQPGYLNGTPDSNIAWQILGGRAATDINDAKNYEAQQWRSEADKPHYSLISNTIMPIVASIILGAISGGTLGPLLAGGIGAATGAATDAGTIASGIGTGVAEGAAGGIGAATGAATDAGTIASGIGTGVAEGAAGGFTYPFFQDPDGVNIGDMLEGAGKGALIGGVTGGLTNAITPATTSITQGIQNATGLSPGVSNAITGGLTGMGTNAVLNAVQGNDISLPSIAQSGLMGAWQGYSGTPTDNGDSLYAQDFARSGLDPASFQNSDSGFIQYPDGPSIIPFEPPPYDGGWNPVDASTYDGTNVTQALAELAAPPPKPEPFSYQPDEGDFARGEINYNVPGWDTQNPDPNAPVTGMIDYPQGFSYLDGNYYDANGVVLDAYDASNGSATWLDGSTYNAPDEWYSNVPVNEVNYNPDTGWTDANGGTYAQTEASANNDVTSNRLRTPSGGGSDQQSGGGFKLPASYAPYTSVADYIWQKHKPLAGYDQIISDMQSGSPQEASNTNDLIWQDSNKRKSFASLWDSYA